VRGLKSLGERFQSAFPADGVAEKDDEKVEHLILPETTSHTMHLRVDQSQGSIRVPMLGNEHDFAKPGGS
jgi:hypothetical protein